MMTTRIRTAAKALLLATAIATPLAVVSQVNASTEAVIGETAKKSNGVGLVLLVSLQRS